MDDRPRQRAVSRNGLAHLIVLLLAALFVTYSFSASANESALEWLRAQRSLAAPPGEDSEPATPFQAASEALEVLYAAGATRSELARIGDTLRLDDPAGADTEYLARRIIAGIRLGEDVSALTVYLLARQGTNGGFSPLPGHGSTLLDTALALRALASAGLENRTESQLAAGFLFARQDHAGGWSGAGSGPEAHLTALAMNALWSVRNAIPAVGSLERARAFLLAQRGPDALWGETFSGALALLALLPTLDTVDPVARSIEVLRARQSANGSWQQSVYTTALAARALAIAALPVPNPDLAAVRGTVVDAETGEALSGASLSLSAHQTHGAVTGGDGAFELVGLEADRKYTLNVGHRGFAPLSSALYLDQGRIVDLGALPLLRDSTSPHGTVRGVVRGALEGRPLTGVEVRLPGAGLSVATDSEGRYRIDGVPAGAWATVAELAGYRMVTALLDVTGGATVLFSPELKPAIPAGPALVGVVRDGHSGLPVAGATVMLEGDVAGTTDATGYIELDGPWAGETTLAVEAFGYETFVDTLRLTDFETTIFTATLYRHGGTPVDAYTAGITGIIMDPLGDEPLEDVLVVMSYGASHEMVRSGADGSFRISGLSSGTASLLIGGEGREVLRYAVALAPGRVLDLGLLRLAPHDAGVLLPDLEVAAGEPWSVDWGAAEGEAAGSVTALVTNSGYGLAAAGIEVTAFYDTNLDGSFDPAFDEILGVSHTAEAMAPLERSQIGVPVRGPLPFGDAPVRLYIDSLGQVPEADEDNNVSALTCRAQPWLSDDFDDGVAAGWTEVPNQIGEVSRWEVVEGAYGVEGGGGTWAGDPAWGDYSLRVRMRVPESSRNDAGVLFRYQDALNWYQFRFRNGLARIIARIDGEVFADLVESPVLIDPERWYRWRADVSGDTVQVYLDDLPVLAYQGLVLERGAVGFMNDGVTAYHDDLVVLPVLPPAGLADLTVSHLTLLDNGAGQPPGVRVRVGNGGNSYSASGTVLGIYTGERALPGQLLQSVALGVLAPGAFTDIEVPAIALADGATLSALVNPERRLVECSFDNNLASTAFYSPEVPGQVAVAAAGGPFVAGQSVPLPVTVSNLGRFTGSYRLAVTVEDLRGGTAAELVVDAPLVLAGGEVQKLALSWSTAGFLEGDYQVQAKLRTPHGTVLDQAWLRIGLGAARQTGGVVAVRASTDRTRYGVADTVAVGALVRNLTVARLIPRVLLRVQIEDASGATLFAQSFELGSLTPGAQVVRETRVPLGGARPGIFAVSTRVLDADSGALLNVDTVEVEVASRPLGHVSGRVSLSAPVLAVHQRQICTMLLSARDGGLASRLQTRLSVLDLADGRPTWQTDDEIAIAGDDVFESDKEIPAGALTQGSYACVLQAGANGAWRTLDFATFLVEPAVIAAPTVFLEPDSTAGELGESSNDGSHDAVTPQHTERLGADAGEGDGEPEIEIEPGVDAAQATPGDPEQGRAAVQPHAVPAVSLVSLAILALSLGLLGSRRQEAQ